MDRMKDRTNKPRVLLVAEAANPEWASVPLIGWSLSRALAQVADVHLITHVRNRDAIARRGLIEGRDFTAIDNEYLAARIYKLSESLRGGQGKGWTTVTGFSSLSYYSFEIELWRQFRARLSAGEFDLVHRITPLSPTSPSIIAKRLSRLNIPFVIGPLNGGLPWPKAFRTTQYAERDWMSHVRWLFKSMPGYRSTRRYSSRIIAGSKFTHEEMPGWCRSKCVYIPENGVDLTRFDHVRNHSATVPLKGAFVGRLVPYKGADILLESAERFLKAGQLQLHFVGDGPQREALNAMVERMGVGSAVTFHGWVPHGEVQKTLSICDFLALPSIREFGGGVVVEAMAMGIAPIVANYGGPAELVDDSRGILISFHDRMSLVQGLTLAISKVVHSPDVLDELGAAARLEVIKHLTWQAMQTKS
jgi:glycosyltransferase involved in cell wall biosynthesis